MDDNLFNRRFPLDLCLGIVVSADGLLLPFWPLGTSGGLAGGFIGAICSQDALLPSHCRSPVYLIRLSFRLIPLVNGPWNTDHEGACFRPILTRLNVSIKATEYSWPAGTE